MAKEKINIHLRCAWSATRTSFRADQTLSLRLTESFFLERCVLMSKPDHIVCHRAPPRCTLQCVVTKDFHSVCAPSKSKHIIEITKKRRDSSLSQSPKESCECENLRRFSCCAFRLAGVLLTFSHILSRHAKMP